MGLKIINSSTYDGSIPLDMLNPGEMGKIVSGGNLMLHEKIVIRCIDEAVVFTNPPRSIGLGVGSLGIHRVVRMPKGSTLTLEVV